MRVERVSPLKGAHTQIDLDTVSIADRAEDSNVE